MIPNVPKQRSGLLHIVDAAGYSWAGMQRLLQETAAKLELIAAAIGFLILYLVQASPAQYFIFAALCGLVLLTEALNTAIEVIVDHLSPDWSVMAKNAKDLGSLAVAISLMIAGGYVAALALI